ncbi:hypothetical protein B0H17DRAFT_1034033 [Mycena rosella]|uniref:HNH nuclease domain-containing protein n=1 Tax=Mycena rosella TaxID=1033263 RepID=A0AAD7GYE6_MYCRO|nr:hypothetical protein B0H17DRAFT_1034033 [Mycena rosella]
MRTDREVMKIFDVNTTDQPDFKLSQSWKMWTMLKIFGSREIKTGLLGMKIHNLQNTLTLNTEDHDLMDTLQLWFEPTGTPDEYHVRVRKNMERPVRVLAGGHRQRVMTVNFPSTSELPAPSPHHLALHAACCRIAHLSGAADHLERVGRDFDNFKGVPYFQVTHEALDSLTRALAFG